MDFPIDIVFDMTSMVMHIDIVFFYDFNGVAHRYRIFLVTSMVFPTGIVFKMTSMVLPIDIVFLDMTSTCFPHRYRVFI